ncbi:MAG: molybdenum-dependent transcriptional regulator, partial [Pseudomonas orientalis]|nr:molybdenum-dependent transcriptional regulator [Pseudomonas orientalis]
LPNGQVLCALAQPAVLSALNAAPGQPIQVQFAPGQVLLGTPV